MKVVYIKGKSSYVRIFFEDGSVIKVEGDLKADCFYAYKDSMRKMIDIVYVFLAILLILPQQTEESLDGLKSRDVRIINIFPMVYT